MGFAGLPSFSEAGLALSPGSRTRLQQAWGGRQAQPVGVPLSPQPCLKPELQLPSPASLWQNWYVADGPACPSFMNFY